MKFRTKNRAILPFNCRSEIENVKVDAIGDDFIKENDAEKKI